MKTAEREQARRLRREEGRSVKELAGLLGVSSSSISLWVRDIELTSQQREALRRRMGGRIDGSRANAVRALERRREAQATGRAQAKDGDLIHVAGCMLFWAEGSRARNKLDFVNSDPAWSSSSSRFCGRATQCPTRRSRSLATSSLITRFANARPRTSG